MDNLLVAKGLHKVFSQGSSSLTILRCVDFSIASGEAVCILGSSGAGKSTLLQILGTLDRPSEGQLHFEGEDLLAEDDEKLALFRNQKMGFVFQFHHLISEFTAAENIELPARIAGASGVEAHDRALRLLDYMGLSDRANHFPHQLSGGELQRVAIARGLINNPKILFADEPTGNLDSANAKKIQDLLFELKQKLGLSLVVVTHDMGFAGLFNKVLRLKDGQWL